MSVDGEFVLAIVRKYIVQMLMENLCVRPRPQNFDNQLQMNIKLYQKMYNTFCSGSS